MDCDYTWNIRARKEQLVGSKYIILPPHYIKLGSMEQFGKGMDKNVKRFTCLTNKFSCISEAKIKKNVFGRQQIRVLIKTIDTLLFSSLENVSYSYFKTHFCCSRENIILKYRDLICNMSIKVLFLKLLYLH